MCVECSVFTDAQLGSNCNSWSGGSMSFTDSSSDWIWAYKSGSAVNSDSQTINLPQHTNYGATTFNLQSATGGDSVNPFVATAAAAASSSAAMPSSGSSDNASGYEKQAPPSNYNKVLLAHAVLGPVAFAILFPTGAILIRVLSFKGLVWLHAGWMISTYAVVLLTMSLGVWMAVKSDLIGTYHAIIGLVVVGSLLLQPITGLVHHRIIKRTGRPNFATYPHIWWGRTVITIGIINGGLGLGLAGETAKYEIIYGVFTGIIWLTWMMVNRLTYLTYVRNRDNNRVPTETIAAGLNDSVEHMKQETRVEEALVHSTRSDSRRR